MTGKGDVLQRMMETRRLKNFILGYFLGLAISYIVSSLIRLAIGDPAVRAWTPSSALLGLWVAFTLWIVTFPFILRAVQRRRNGA
jgi:hypothetical protein